MDEILQIKDLTKKYGDFKLDQVSFSIPKGSIMGLMKHSKSPSRAGETSRRKWR